jgi:hypothetical protein
MWSKEKFFKYFSGLLLLIIISSSVFSVQAAPLQQDEDPVIISTESEEINPYFTIITETYSDGTTANQAIINGPPDPPEGYTYEVIREEDLDADRAVKLNNFPSYNWVFGCSAVSGGMMAGYWDRHGFPNMYAGPKNGGVMPLSNVWGTWSDGSKTYPNNPLIASHKGVDGRTKKGSIDDYWVKYGSTAKDPYITGGWTQHTWGTAIGDYMKTSQSKYSNTDGASAFYYTYSNGGKLTCADMINKGYTKDGTLGIKQFYQKRGYTVTNCYSQVIDTYMSSKGYSGGFTLADYKAQINAGNPVFINVMGHSMVGFGYGSGNTIYIRNTWDNNPSNVYSMQWGGSYSGMLHYQVVIVNLKKPVSVVPKTISPKVSVATHRPTYKWSKVPNAQAYIVQVYQGSTKKFAKSVPASVCASGTCKFTPKWILADGNYKWRVRAKVGGTWRAFSPFTNFNVATEFHYQFTLPKSLDRWNVAFGPWSLSGGKYRSNGLSPYWNSVFHDGLYPTLSFIVSMQRFNTSGPNSLFVRGTPYPLASDKYWSDGYQFSYSNSGVFGVWKMIDGGYTCLQPWTSTSAINQYNWNTVKVKAKDNILKFYINNQLVWSGTDSTYKTGKVGVGFYKADSTSQALAIDYAHLYTYVPTIDLETDVWAEFGETFSEWDNPNIVPQLP